MNETQERPTQAQTRDRIQIFTADTAQDLLETDMMDVPPEKIPEGYLKRAEELRAGVDGGSVTRILFRDEKSGFSLVYAWFKSGYPLPPHTHNADCLYYIVSGSLKLGTRSLGAGDGFFVPKDTFYSYTPGSEGVEVLEFRNQTGFDFVMRDGIDAVWERMANTFKSNAQQWLTEGPPARQPSGKG